MCCSSSTKTSRGARIKSFQEIEVKLAGFTPYADQEWMEQQARNMTMEE